MANSVVWYTSEASSVTFVRKLGALELFQALKWLLKSDTFCQPGSLLSSQPLFYVELQGTEAWPLGGGVICSRKCCWAELKLLVCSHALQAGCSAAAKTTRKNQSLGQALQRQRVGSIAEFDHESWGERSKSRHLGAKVHFEYKRDPGGL